MARSEPSTALSAGRHGVEFASFAALGVPCSEPRLSHRKCSAACSPAWARSRISRVSSRLRRLAAIRFVWGLSRFGCNRSRRLRNCSWSFRRCSAAEEIVCGRQFEGLATSALEACDRRLCVVARLAGAGCPPLEVLAGDSSLTRDPQGTLAVAQSVQASQPESPTGRRRPSSNQSRRGFRRPSSDRRLMIPAPRTS